MKPAGGGAKYNANARSPDFEQRNAGKNVMRIYLFGEILKALKDCMLFLFFFSLFFPLSLSLLKKSLQGKNRCSMIYLVRAKEREKKRKERRNKNARWNNKI